MLDMWVPLQLRDHDDLRGYQQFQHALAQLKHGTDPPDPGPGPSGGLL